MNTQPTFSGLRRDGHLTDLAVDHELDQAPLHDVQDHLATCSACQARVTAAQAHDDALPALPAFQPPSATTYETPKAANRPWMWASMLAVAATTLFVATATLQSVPPEDGYRVKGSGLTLQVFRDEGETSSRLKNGDRIEPGDRLGFRVRQRRAGHLMVVGIDALDEPYLCFPQSGGQKSAEMTASLEPRPLPEAIRMDDTRGAELLVAVLCDAPFTYDEITTAIARDDLPANCSSHSVELVKP